MEKSTFELDNILFNRLRYVINQDIENRQKEIEYLNAISDNPINNPSYLSKHIEIKEAILQEVRTLYKTIFTPSV